MRLFQYSLFIFVIQLLSISNSFADTIAPSGPFADARQREWMRTETNIFFHFTVNTFTGAEWGDGKEILDTNLLRRN